MHDNDLGSRKRRFSPVRLSALLIIAVAVPLIVSSRLIDTERERSRASQIRAVQSVLQLLPQTPAVLSEEFQDRDGDMIADSPSELPQSGTVESLRFSYLAGVDIEIPDETWRELMDKISAQTDVPVELARFLTVDDQLAALKSGDLHIAAFNTGSVTTAVNECGFVPVAALADKYANTGYSAKIIVPSVSPIKSPSDITSLMFTSPTSNSGFRFPMLALAKNFGLYPDRHYIYRFSQSHESSIKAVLNNDVPAAAVASDVLDLVLQREGVSGDAIRTIYESPKFPSACFGYSYSLGRGLGNKIRSVLEEFKFSSDPRHEPLAASGFVGLSPIDFKEDFSEIRLIESVVSGELDFGR